MRLQKYLAQCGVASRRKAEEYILEGRVTVNGCKVDTLGTQVEPSDCITVDQKVVQLETKKVYYMLNKPVGYVTTVSDEKGRATVMDLLKGVEERVFPVGRLDYQTSGLLILTNDGELTYGLTHPKHEVDKIYKAEVKGRVEMVAVQKLQEGILLEGRLTAKAQVKILQQNLKRGTTTLQIGIHEGRNRQVRKMCEFIGHPVLKLHRQQIGLLTLKDLKEGCFRPLTPQEVDYLKKIGEGHVK